MNPIHMIRGRRWPALLAAGVGLLAVCLSVTSVQDARAATPPLDEQWRVDDHSVPSGTAVETGYQFKLFNRDNGEMLIRKNQRWGIDLDFVPDPNNGFEGIKFERQAGPGAVRYGDQIAIYVVGGGYLKYQSGHTTTVGLAYSSTPTYQWKFTGGANESIVRTGESAGLYNTNVDKWLVWAFQFTGINLGFEAPPQPPQTAGASLSWRVGPFPTPGTGTAPCQATVNYRLVPVNLTGSTGKSTTVFFNPSFAEFAETFGPGQYYCVYTALTGGLKTGTWRIEGSTPLWSTSCSANLHTGANTANFTSGKNSCVVNGVTFP